MKRFLHNALAGFLIVSMASINMEAAAPAAMLRSDGGVSVNGNSVTPITTVFSGDRIQTAPKSIGSLYVNGSSIALEENSTLMFMGQDFDFACGGGLMKTTTGLGARFGRLSIKPTSQDARFAIGQSASIVKVSALEGDLSIFDGSKTVDLFAGHSINLAYAGCSSQQSRTAFDSNDNVQDTNPPKSTGSLDTGTASNSSVGTIYVIAPVVVAIVATVAILAVNQKPVSPTVP